MGREVRMVPADWQHPKAYNSLKGEDCFVPLYDGSFAGGYKKSADEWDEAWAKWQEGLCRDYGDSEKWVQIEPEYRHMRYTDYAGQRPSPDDYMPNWPASERTHLMMYEDTSEGTPISPAFETPEELARWLTDNNASAFARYTASYEQWLATCKRGFAPCAIFSAETGLVSGVAGLDQ